MAHNQRFNNDEKYDPEATEALRALIRESRFSLDSIDQMKKEIRQGADPRVLRETNLIQAYPGTSPLKIIAEMGQADFLQELFAMGLEPTFDMLHAVITSGIPPKKRLDTMTAILDENPDLVHVNPVGSSGKTTTPLLLAIREGMPIGVIELLLKYGANPDLQDQNGITPLMDASFYDLRNRRKLVELLLQYGADTQLENKNGDTARNYNSRKILSNLLPSREGGRRKTRRLKRKKNNKSKTGKSRRRH